ncbi:MAG: GTP-binding protein [Polyangiales bacterium]
MSPVPVTVVTGFLGAGKTTLVNHWLSQTTRGDIAVVVNELGAVGIDGELLAERAQTLVEIAGGCVCCTTQAELVEALGRLATSASPPQRILIETSGAASPAGVLRAVAAQEDAWRLDGIVTVVAASRAQTLTDHDLAIEQVGYADIVVMSWADQCDEMQRTAAEAAVATHNGAAVSVTSDRGHIAAAPTLDALLALRRADFAPPRTLAPRHSVYDSISLVLEGALDGERFADFMELQLGRYAGRLFRIKGILAVNGLAERMIVQGVADLVEVTFGEPWAETQPSSRLVIVGYGLDRAELTDAFAACAEAAVR